MNSNRVEQANAQVSPILYVLGFLIVAPFLIVWYCLRLLFDFGGLFQQVAQPGGREAFKRAVVEMDDRQREERTKRQKARYEASVGGVGHGPVASSFNVDLDRNPLGVD